jgi:hypothetical protein
MDLVLSDVELPDGKVFDLVRRYCPEGYRPSFS